MPKPFFIFSSSWKDRDRQLLDVHCRLNLDCGQIKITILDFG
uniref:Uncharacterized protein n=1 Tax=Setaria italica TaxID=4555 RepID=K4A401_SETIT